MMEWWQHLPEHIDPIAFMVGFFSVRWYALFWLAGFAASWSWARSDRSKTNLRFSGEELLDLFLFLFLGAFLGGHLGYALFYRPEVFLTDPLGFFLPYHGTTGWSGIAGMSFHGGLLGVLVVLLWFARKRKVSFWLLSDFIALVAPIALFFGRLGNFFALELYGRVTTSPWGMYFPGAPGDMVLRHPSPLYEAFGEGLCLFLGLLFMRQRSPRPGVLSAWFLLGYGVIRFVLEYVREPDWGLLPVAGLFTHGQFLSLFLVLGSGGLFIWFGVKNRGKIEK